MDGELKLLFSNLKDQFKPQRETNFNHIWDKYGLPDADTQDLKNIDDYYDENGFKETSKNMDPVQFDKFLNFRHSQIQEEVDELKDALENDDAEEIVDALIDI